MGDWGANRFLSRNRHIKRLPQKTSPDPRRRQQRLRRGIEARPALLYGFGDFLAQLHAKLVEGIDAHKHGVGESAVQMSWVGLVLI